MTTDLDEERFEHRFLDLDPEERAAFVARLYEHRGWEAAHGDDRVTVTPPSDAAAEPRTLRVAPDATSPEPSGGDTGGHRTVAADPAALYEMALYAIDRRYCDELFAAFFDATAPTRRQPPPPHARRETSHGESGAHVSTDPAADSTDPGAPARRRRRGTGTPAASTRGASGEGRAAPQTGDGEDTEHAAGGGADASAGEAPGVTLSGRRVTRRGVAVVVLVVAAVLVAAVVASTTSPGSPDGVDPDEPVPPDPAVGDEPVDAGTQRWATTVLERSRGTNGTTDRDPPAAAGGTATPGSGGAAVGGVGGPRETDITSLANETRDRYFSATPTCSRPPGVVTAVVVGALGYGDAYPRRAAGVVWRFTSPLAQHFIGPFDRFVVIMEEPGYEPLLGHDSATLGPVAGTNRTVTQLVSVADGNETATYEFMLTRQPSSRREGCWLIDRMYLVSLNGERVGNDTASATGTAAPGSSAGTESG